MRIFMLKKKLSKWVKRNHIQPQCFDEKQTESARDDRSLMAQQNLCLNGERILIKLACFSFPIQWLPDVDLREHVSLL